MEKCLQEINPNLHYTELTELILKSTAKVYLMELFEEAIEMRERMKMNDIDEEVLEMAAKSLEDKRRYSQ